MEIRDLVSQLISKNIADHLAEESKGPEASGRLRPVPRLHPPAGEAQVAELGIRSGQQLDPGYREFLLLADGMEGFQLSMPLFGCHDWAEGGRAAEGVALGEELLEDGCWVSPSIRVRTTLGRPWTEIDRTGRADVCGRPPSPAWV